MWWLIFTSKEKTEEARTSVSEGKRNITGLTEHVERLQSELNQSELRREELETELSNCQEVRGVSV